VVVTVKWRAPGPALFFEDDGLIHAPAAHFMKNARTELRAIAAATLETREHPLLIWYPVKVVGKETIRLPRGYRLAEDVEEVDVGGDIASFRLTASEKGNKIEIEEELVISKRTLQPDEYGELYESVEALKDFASSKIQIAK